MKLTDFPDRLLQISTKVFLRSELVYYLLVRIVGRRKSKVESIKFQDIIEKLMDDVKFC